MTVKNKAWHYQQHIKTWSYNASCVLKYVKTLLKLLPPATDDGKHIEQGGTSSHIFAAMMHFDFNLAIIGSWRFVSSAIHSSQMLNNTDQW